MTVSIAWMRKINNCEELVFCQIVGYLGVIVGINVLKSCLFQEKTAAYPLLVAPITHIQ